MAIDKINIVKLAEILWSWSACADCKAGDACSTTAKCPGTRVHNLWRYYQFCEAVLRPNPSEDAFAARFLDNDDKHLRVIESVKSNPDISRDVLTTLVWGNGSTSSSPQVASTIDRAIRIMTMVDCSSLHQSSGRLEEGVLRIPWRGQDSFSQFLEQAIPFNHHRILSNTHDPQYKDIKDSLRADRLKRCLGISFRGTSDLQDHLKLKQTPRGLVLEVYHHAAFLKEHLRLTKTAARQGLDVAQCLRMYVSL
jgi:hypothetical protein